MIKFVKSNYDIECGISYVKIRTELGDFDGYAFLNPEDKKYESQFLGLEIAEMRATIDYLEKKNTILKTKLIALHDLKNTYKAKNFDMDAEMIKILENKIKQYENQKREYQEDIKEIKNAIYQKVENAITFVNRVNRIRAKKQGE